MDYTSGELCAPNMTIIWKFAKNKHSEEVVMHELLGKNILRARAVRIGKFILQFGLRAFQVLRKQKKLI